MDIKGANLKIEEKAALQFLIQRNVTDLFKEFLRILERNSSKHTESLNKLYDSLPEDYKKYVYLADWLTEEEETRCRKEVLYRGNEAIRKINEEVEKFSIQIK